MPSSNANGRRLVALLRQPVRIGRSRLPCAARIPGRTRRGTMAPPAYDYVIVGGGSAGCALANRLSADPANRVLVLEAGRPDYPWDVFIHMPAALTFPIGSRFYDWKYESEPEPHMDGRRIYHARGKVLGGSSSINGMIFQRGNPLDYERWAADPGMETWDYAHCLPYFKRMENCLAADPDDEFRGHDGPLVLERGPATNPLFEAFFEAGAAGRLPAHRRRQRLPAGGLRRLRPQRPPRPAAVGGAGLPAPRDEAGPTSTVTTRALVTRDPLRGQARRRRGVPARPRARHSRSAPARSSSAAARSTRRSCCSSPASATRRSSSALGIDVVHDLPGRRREPAGPPRGLRPVRLQAAGLDAAVPASSGASRWIGAAVAVPRKGPAATNHFEGGGFVRSNEDVAYPNLMFHFLPIAVRYDGSSPDGRARLPGARRADVLRRPRLGEDHEQGPARAPGAALQLPLHRAGPARVGRGDPRGPRASSTSPRSTPFNGGEVSPGPAVETDEEILDWVAQRRRDRAAPVVHAARWAPTRCPWSTR